MEESCAPSFSFFRGDRNIWCAYFESRRAFGRHRGSGDKTHAETLGIA
jgi:hypothetical protein